MLEMLPRRVDMIGDERAARADLIRPWCQHDMIDGELALAAEQVAERAVALGSFKDIGLLDLGPWQLPALGAATDEPVAAESIWPSASLRCPAGFQKPGPGSIPALAKAMSSPP